MPNVVQAWLELIGTPERAEKLRAAYAANWLGCPSRALFGADGSTALYVDPRYTAALDAWDTGMVTRRDVLQWAAHIARGEYAGPVYS